MGDKIHPTHFQVPEMPYKKREKEAILFLQKIVDLYKDYHDDKYFWWVLDGVIIDNKDLVDWVMKYKGE